MDFSRAVKLCLPATSERYPHLHVTPRGIWACDGHVYISVQVSPPECYEPTVRLMGDTPVECDDTLPPPLPQIDTSPSATTDGHQLKTLLRTPNTDLVRLGDLVLPAKRTLTVLRPLLKKDQLTVHLGEALAVQGDAYQAIIQPMRRNHRWSTPSSLSMTTIPWPF